MTGEIDDIEVVRELAARASDGWPPMIERDRQRYEEAGQELSPDTPFREIEVAGIRGELVGESSGPAIIVYLHGGAYVLGSPRSHRHLAARLASEAKIAALVPEYPLAPESPYPAAIDSVTGLVEELCRSKTVLLAGDSAGGALALVTYDRLTRRYQEKIKGLILFSPWLDQRLAGRQYEDAFDHDHSISPHRLQFFSRQYLNGASAENPEVTPLLGARSTLPPTLIQVGSREILRTECEEFATECKARGLPVEIEIWNESVHVWQWYWPILESGRAAVARAGKFAAGLRLE